MFQVLTSSGKRYDLQLRNFSYNSSSSLCIKMSFWLHFTKKEKWQVAKNGWAWMTVIYIQRYSLFKNHIGSFKENLKGKTGCCDEVFYPFILALQL